MAKKGLEEVFPNANLYADINDKDTLPKEKYDCIIATQVIVYMYDVERVMNNMKSMLKPGGTLLLTVPGTISEHRQERCWNFSENALKELCKSTFGNFDDLRTYGNSTYGLYMLFRIKKNPFEEPKGDDYLHSLILGVKCRKQ